MIEAASIAQSLDDRQRDVLFATIAEYVSSGAPVSSRALAGRRAVPLSPASIRRTLRDLTVRGFLLQPHTSAGRVPTDQGFRVFVSALRRSASEMEPSLRERLLSGIRNLLPLGDGRWREAVRLMSDLSTRTALMMTPAVSDSVLRQLRFVPLGGRQLLAVIVTRDGLVRNAYVESEDEVEERELERIHNYLAEITRGRTLNDIRHVLRSELENARSRCDALRERASLLGSEAIRAGASQDSELLVEGHSHLLAQPEIQDRIQELVEVLEKKSRVLDLLDRAAETDEGPLVIIGREAGPGFEGCAVIAAPFRRDGAEGQLGLVGSTRMDFGTVIPLVRFSARLLSEKTDSEN
ncbi:MAG: heat-inducible transcriptional repressor HrcA [Polyangia bacterium]